MVLTEDAWIRIGRNIFPTRLKRRIQSDFEFHLYELRLISRFIIFITRCKEITGKCTRDISWSEPLRVDNELSNSNSWRESHEKDQTALRPGIQNISSSRA